MRHSIIINTLEIVANNAIRSKELEDCLESSALEGFEFPEPKPIQWSDVSVEDVLSAVASYRNQLVADIISKSRKRELVYSRYLYSIFCIFILNKEKNRHDLTLSKIGRPLGKDHSMIIHYKKDYNDVIELNKKHPTFSNRNNEEKVKNELLQIETILIETRILNL